MFSTNFAALPIISAAMTASAHNQHSDQAKLLETEQRKEDRHTEDQQSGDWAALLEEMRQEYWASPDLTEEQKRYLDSLENLPEEEWEPIVCEGKPLSETIIEDRGPR